MLAMIAAQSFVAKDYGDEPAAPGTGNGLLNTSLPLYGARKFHFPGPYMAAGSSNRVELKKPGIAAGCNHVITASGQGIRRQ
jgi:hypothetical protein